MIKFKTDIPLKRLPDHFITFAEKIGNLGYRLDSLLYRNIVFRNLSLTAISDIWDLKIELKKVYNALTDFEYLELRILNYLELGIFDNVYIYDNDSGEIIIDIIRV